MKQHLKCKSDHHAVADKPVDCANFIDPGISTPTNWDIRMTEYI